jgi:hypothetical protein
VLEEDEVEQQTSAATGSESDSELFVPRKRRTANTRRGREQQQLQSPTLEAAATAAAAAPDDQHTPGLGHSAEALTLVLFDEADTLLDADRGFLAALPGLIKDSRRPIVLCLNSPQLPAALASVQGLQVQQVSLLRPSEVELVRLLVLVLVAEGRTGVSLRDVQRLVQQQVRCGLQGADVLVLPGVVWKLCLLSQEQHARTGYAGDGSIVDAIL